jgi:hypothetical protein
MVLRQDDRQFMIYDPSTVSFVFEALNAAALVMFGAWLQRVAGRSPSTIKDNLGQIGAVVANIGEARQQINAGLAPNNVPDRLVTAQRSWDAFSRWVQDPSSVSEDHIADVIDQFSGAMAYLNERTHDTGTNHPRWNSRIVSGQPCESCGR